MKILNINIPTTFRFIKAISKFWVLIVIILIILLYTYFWLNTVDENGIGISVNTNYITNPLMSVDIRLNDSIIYSHKNKIADIIEVHCSGEIAHPNYPKYINALKSEDKKQIIKSLQNPDTLNESGKSLYKSNMEHYKIIYEDDNSNDKIPPIFKDFFNRKENAPFIELSIRSKNQIIDVFNYNKKKKNGYFWSGNIVQEHDEKDLKVYSNKTNNSYIYEHFKKDGDMYETRFNYILHPSSEGETISITNSYLGDFFTSIKSRIRVRLSFSFNAEHSDRGESYKYANDHSNTDILPYRIEIHHYRLPLYILTLYPEPDIINQSTIIYSSEDKLRLIKNNGISIYAENLNNKDLNEKLNFILASFIGVLFSVLAEIAVKHFGSKRKLSPLGAAQVGVDAKETSAYNIQQLNKRGKKRRKKRK